MDLYQKIKDKSSFFLMAGPCVIEDYDTMIRIAEFLKIQTNKRGIPFIFKASFEKANRTSVDSYRGPGIDEGLKILQKIKDAFNVKIVTDIHLPSQAKAVAEVADIIQIPAFLSRQTELLLAASQTNKIVNIKKAQFMAPEDIQNAAEKILSENNDKIMLTERGVTFGYHNLVVDFRSFAVMHDFGYPVVYDITHSLQMPSIGKNSGGTPQYVPMMANAAIATGKVDGLFIETHPNPLVAKSDAKSMLTLDKIPKLLDECKKIYNIMREK